MVKFALVVLLTTSMFSKEIQMLFAPSTPPYVFKDGSGITIDIVKESLAFKGHTLKPIFLELGRGFEMFKNGYVDATSIMQKSTKIKAFYSEYYMQYHNGAFVLNKNIQIDTIEDLARYYVSAFQNAHIYLGKKFGKTVEAMKEKYEEIADQKKQVLMLLKGRSEIAIMDRHIFRFYKNMLISENKVDKDIQASLIELFSPTKYRTAFKDKKIRDDFNAGLEELKKSGRYDEIYKYYSQKYFTVEK